MGSVRRVAGLALAVLVLVAGAPPAAAHDVSDPERRRREIRTELGRLREELDEAAAAEAELLAELAVTRHAKRELDARVAELDAQVAAARGELRSAERSLAVAEARHRVAERELREAQAALEAARTVLEEQAVAAFVRRGLDGAAEIEVLLNVRDIRQLNEARAYFTTIARHQSAVVERHDALRADVRDKVGQRAEARDDASARREAVAARTAALEAARAEQDAIRDRVAAEVAREEWLVGRIRAEQDRYGARIRSLERESAEVEELLRRRQAGQGIARCSDGRLDSPMPGHRVSSGYGWRTHPIFGGRRMHTGIDFSASYGTGIRAAAAGTVVFAGWKGGYGYAVVLDHGDSLATLYAHMSRIRVSSGRDVAAGQLVGDVGSTGYSTGPHLHFEVRINGRPVDPLGCL